MNIGGVLGSVGAAALAALVTFGSASAAPVPIVPGGTVVIAGGNDYAFTSDTLIGVTSGTSTFNFVYLGGIASASNDTSINPKLQIGKPNSYTSVVVSWLIGNTTLASHTFTNGEFGTTLPIALSTLTTNAATTYHLVIDWVKPALSTAVFDTVISTIPATPVPTPLPPAALLFGSVLAGLGLMGRRRMAANRQQKA